MNRVPYDAQIDTKILMGQDVPKILDLSPWNLLILSLYVLGQFAYGFADDFELPDDRRVSHPIYAEIFEFEVFDIRLNSLSRVSYVSQIELVVSIRHGSCRFARLF